MSVQTISYFDALISQSDVLSHSLSPSDVVSVFSVLYNARLIGLQKTIRIDITPHVDELLSQLILSRPKTIYYLAYDVFSYVHNYPAYGHLSSDDIAHRLLNAPNVTSYTFITFLAGFSATAAYTTVSDCLYKTTQHFTGSLPEFFASVRTASNRASSDIYKVLRDKAKL